MLDLLRRRVECIIFILYYNLNPDTVGSAHIKAKERRVRRAKKRKRTEAQRVKSFTLSQAIDAHMGDEEQKEKQGASIQPRSYSGLFLKNTRPQGDGKNRMV